MTHSRNFPDARSQENYVPLHNSQKSETPKLIKTRVYVIILDARTIWAQRRVTIYQSGDWWRFALIIRVHTQLTQGAGGRRSPCTEAFYSLGGGTAEASRGGGNIFQETNSAHKEADGRPFKNYSARAPQRNSPAVQKLLSCERFPKSKPTDCVRAACMRDIFRYALCASQSFLKNVLNYQKRQQKMCLISSGKIADMVLLQLLTRKCFLALGLN